MRPRVRASVRASVRPCVLIPQNVLFNNSIGETGYVLHTSNEISTILKIAFQKYSKTLRIFITVADKKSKMKNHTTTLPRAMCLQSSSRGRPSFASQPPLTHTANLLRIWLEETLPKNADKKFETNKYSQPLCHRRPSSDGQLPGTCPTPRATLSKFEVITAPDQG